MTHPVIKLFLKGAIVLFVPGLMYSQSTSFAERPLIPQDHGISGMLLPRNDVVEQKYVAEQYPLQSPHSNQGSDTGIITGTIVDQMGAVSVRTHVRLEYQSHRLQETSSGTNGEFSFSHVSPGPFRLTITAPGFAVHTFSGNLAAVGQTFIVPAIVLTVANATTEVRVGLSPVEVAQAQVKEQEKQRVLGVIPNFYVSYEPNAVPLTPRLKFDLAWHSSVDPVTFLGVATLAGIAHGTNDLEGYGQGAQGYAKRFGALYADDFIGTFIGSAMLTSLFKQDPRYFYRGKGSVGSRLGHALANAAICKGDNGNWQPNYSGILGSLATGGISYLYYPASDRHGAGLFFTNALIKAGEDSVAGVFQEFVIPRFTPHLRRKNQPKP